MGSEKCHNGPSGRFCAVAKAGKPNRKIRNTDEMELQRDAITTMLIASLLGVKPAMLLRGQEEDLIEILGQAIGRLLALMALLMLMPPSIHRSH